LDLNLVNFSNQQMLPRMQASNVVKVLNLSTEDNASLGFYGDAFGFKLEGKYLQGRHSAIRTLVDLSVLEIIRMAFDSLNPQQKIGLVQVILNKYGQRVEIKQKLDEPTTQALQALYSARYPDIKNVSVLTWEGFSPLFFGVPMPWDNMPEPQKSPPPSEPAKANSAPKVNIYD
jgi:hypothetical protein